MCEIIANYHYFTTEDTKFSLPSKPFSSLCLSILILYICMLLLLYVNCSGGSRGGAWGPCPSLFLDETEAQRAEKIFFGERYFL